MDNPPQTSENIAPEDRSSEEDISRQKQAAEWREELKGIEEDISTLKTLLDSKVKRASELKKKLGLSPLEEISTDIKSGINTVKSSAAYHHTMETIDKIHHSAPVKKAEEVLNAATSAFTKKLNDVTNSVTSSESFHSLESKVGQAYGSVKDKMSRSFSGEGAVKVETADKTTE